MDLDELIELGKRLSAPIGDPTNWDQVTLLWFRSAKGQSDAKFIVAACNSAVPLATELKAAREKIRRLREMLLLDLSPDYTVADLRQFCEVRELLKEPTHDQEP